VRPEWLVETAEWVKSITRPKTPLQIKQEQKTKEAEEFLKTIYKDNEEKAIAVSFVLFVDKGRNVWVSAYLTPKQSLKLATLSGLDRQRYLEYIFWPQQRARKRMKKSK
jgi:hypothetical protein